MSIYLTIIQMLNYSIIIPHKDIPDLLDRLLFTIPRREDTQVIVCDDCSSSENYAAVLALKEKYPQIEIYQTDNCGGGGKARNLGLKHAKGKYLIFADADDYFNLCFPSILDKYADTDYDIVYFTFNSVDNLSYQNSNRGERMTKILNLALLNQDVVSVKYKFPFPVAKFVSLDLVQRNGIIFQESPLSNDVKFGYLSDYYSSDIHADTTAIYCATTRQESTSNDLTWDRFLVRLRIDLEKTSFMRDIAKIEPDLGALEWSYSFAEHHFAEQISEINKLVKSFGFSPWKIRTSRYLSNVTQGLRLAKHAIGLLIRF